MTKLRLPEAPRIMTDRLILRDHRATDFEASVHMWSDKDVVRYIGGVPSAPTDVWSRLLRYAGMWMVCLRKSGPCFERGSALIWS